MSDSEDVTLAQWTALAEQELGDRDRESLEWETPEGITVKPLYNVDDLDTLGHQASLPGFPPYQRGVRATM